MSSSVAQHPVLWLFAALLMGVTVEWILEMFFFRERLFDAESRARRRSEELDSERFVHNRTQAELKNRSAELEAAQKGRTLAEALLAAARGKLSAAGIELASAREECARTASEMAELHRRIESAAEEVAEFRAAGLDAVLKLEEARAESATHESASTEHRSHLAQVCSEIESLRHQAGQERKTDSERSTTLTADLETSRRGEKRLKEALDASQAECSSLRNSREDVEALRATLAGENDALTERVQVLESASAAARAAAAVAEQKLKARSDELKQFAAQLGETTEELAATKSTLARVQANLEAAAATRMSLERELAAREREVEEARNVATPPPPAISAPDPSILADLRDELDVERRSASVWKGKTEELESELLATSRAHQALVQELERIRTSGGGESNGESLAEELESMTRERNELAAELAVRRGRDGN